MIFSATQETSLLGRGEWIKFAAAFFNLDHVADKKFEEVRPSASPSKHRMRRPGVGHPIERTPSSSPII